MHPASLSGALAGAVIPAGLVIELPEAWALIVALLALCCGLLWLLTGSTTGVAPDDRTGSAARRRRRPSRRPTPHSLAHHGSRAA